MNVEEIFENQVIYIKRGRINGLGFEPAFNSYFDFYMNTKYFDPPLIELQDGMFHLFLRKNINDKNPDWRMPTIRQMKQKFRIGQARIDAMLKRLDEAHLLKKISGVRSGVVNTQNHYVLSDPINELPEFLAAAVSGGFGRPLHPEWEADSYVPEMGTYIPEMGTTHVPEMGTLKHTLIEQKGDTIWNSVLLQLRTQILEATFYTFVANTQLEKIEGDTATIIAPRANNWLDRQMLKQFRTALNLELRLAGRPEIKEIRIVSDDQ